MDVATHQNHHLVMSFFIVLQEQSPRTEIKIHSLTEHTHAQYIHQKKYFLKPNKSSYGKQTKQIISYCYHKIDFKAKWN